MAEALILGLGNILLHDESAGVRAVERLKQRYLLSEDVEALDGGVRGMALLPFLEGISRLIIIDAVRAGKPPGTISRWEGDQLSLPLGPTLSSHQEGVADLLWAALATDILPAEVVFWGIEPAFVETGLELSPAIECQLDALVDHVVEELRRWGYRVEALPEPTS